MALKETIACVGVENEIYAAFIQKLANEKYRLLLVSENEQQLFPYSKSLRAAFPDTPIETIACAKEGCWEADVILIAGESVNATLILKISEVATQKIVVCLSLDTDDALRAEERAQHLQKSLPYTKVLELLLNPSVPEAILSGKDAEALATTEYLLKKSGFRIKQIRTE